MLTCLVKSSGKHIRKGVKSVKRRGLHSKTGRNLEFSDAATRCQRNCCFTVGLSACSKTSSYFIIYTVRQIKHISTLTAELVTVIHYAFYDAIMSQNSTEPHRPNIEATQCFQCCCLEIFLYTHSPDNAAMS